MDKEAVNAGLRTGGAPAFKFQNPGDRCVGVVTDARWEAERDFKTGQPKTFADGNEIQQLVVTVQTDIDGDDDGGLRRLFLKGSKKRATTLGAVVQALASAGCELEVGGTLALTYTGEGEAATGQSPPKNYSAEYFPPGY